MRLFGDPLRPVFLKLRDALRRRAIEEEIDEELRHHIEMATQDYVDRGLPVSEARRKALIAFGGIERFKEEVREARGLLWLDDLKRDWRHAWRLLSRDRIFTGACVAALALGIGANTAIFSVIHAVLLKPLPFGEPSRLVMVWETDRHSDTTREPGSWPDLQDYRDRSRTLESLAAFMSVRLTWTSARPDPIQVPALAVTPDLMSVLRVEPLLGRGFAPEESRVGGPLVAVLAEGFWRAHFQADPNVLGRTISLDGRPYAVVGVVPEGADVGLRHVHGRAAYHGSFTGKEPVSLWIPLQADAKTYPRTTHPLLMVGRLAAGETTESAGAELAQIAARLETEFPENSGRGVWLEPFDEAVLGPVRTPLFLLLAAVVLVLLVACANVANLLLARGASRAREVALRTAIGASVSRLTRQFLTESLVMTLLGAVAGIGLAHAGLETLLSLAPRDIPRWDEISLDRNVLAFTTAVSVAVAVVLGLVPTLQARRLELQGALKSGAGCTVVGLRRRWRVRSALATGQVALALLVVFAATLLLRSLWELRRVDPGFDAEGVLKAEYELPGTRYPKDFSVYPHWPRITSFHEELMEKVGALPGVRSVAVAAAHPLDAGFTNSFVIVGRESEAETQPEIRTRPVSWSYFETIGLAVVEGRGFRAADDEWAPPVALINEAALRRFFAHQAPLGQRVRFWGATREIVGVVADEKFAGLARPTPPAVYVPLAQAPPLHASLLVRTARDPLALVGPIRAQLRRLDPELALYDVEPLSRTLRDSTARERFTAFMLVLFGSVAFVLALLGVQGLLSYTVAQRTPELGLRMALGATAGQVSRMIVGEGMRMAGTGLAIGVAGALGFSRFLESQVFGVTARDPITLVAAAGCVLVGVVGASWFPARRAGTLRPAEALRTE